MTSPSARNLVVMIAHGPHDELGSAGFTIANGAMTAGLKVSVFLSGSGVDLVRRGAGDSTQFKPLEPLQSLLTDFVTLGGTIWACTPRVQARGYEQKDLIDGATISGASPMLELIQGGAATLSF